MTGRGAPPARAGPPGTQVAVLLASSAHAAGLSPPQLRPKQRQCSPALVSPTDAGGSGKTANTVQANAGDAPAAAASSGRAGAWTHTGVQACLCEQTCSVSLAVVAPMPSRERDEGCLGAPACLNACPPTSPSTSQTHKEARGKLWETHAAARAGRRRKACPSRRRRAPGGGGACGQRAGEGGCHGA